MWEHKNNQIEGFTKKYSVHSLVWFEVHETMESAIGREKAIKNWKRQWKINEIERFNPDWCEWIPASAGMTSFGLVWSFSD